MKKFTILSICLFATFSLIISSCKKDDSNEEEQPNKPAASMTAKIDDVAWSANQSGCTVTDGKGGIAGVGFQAPSIIISLDGFSENTYLLEFNGNSVGVVNDGNITYSTNSDPMAGGSVTITSINTTDSLISGIFEFTAYSFFNKGYISVTEGTFTDIPFTDELPGNSDNSFEVDIDGSAFIPVSITASNIMGQLIISASDAQVTKTIGITVNEDITIGTYEMAGLFGSVTGLYNIGTSIIMPASSGELVVTKHDMDQNILEGTFEFEAEELLGTNSASLTNGSFSVMY